MMKRMPLALLLVLIVSVCPASAAPFRILLDYRFDGGYFSLHPERRIPLEYSAGLWEQVLKSPRRIEAGTKVAVRKSFTEPGETTVTFDEPVDAFVIFIYAFDFAKEVKPDGTPDPSTAKAFGGNYNKNGSVGFLAINTNGDRPWYFDSTPETEYDVPVKNYYDLITTSVHEIGHVLGFLRNRQAPFVRSFGPKDERFSGPAVLRVNDGNPVPLEGAHIRGDWWNPKQLSLPPIDRHVMHTADPVQGYRQLMTAIDLAIMEDIGWEVDYEALPRYPYTIPDDPRKAKAAEVFGLTDGGLNPVGLWMFDRKAGAGSAIVGRPLRYSPPDGKTGGVADLFGTGEIRVPRGGWLYCVPELEPSGEGGTNANRYTLVFDVRLPQIGSFFCLWNSNPDNATDGECFVNPEGHFGVGDGCYSTAKLAAGRWYRLGIVIDADHKSRAYYIDGKFSHEVRDVGLDGRFSLNSIRSKKPFFCLFGDNDGEDAPIDVRSIALYDTPLTLEQMRRLGDPRNTQFGL